MINHPNSKDDRQNNINNRQNRQHGQEIKKIIQKKEEEFIRKTLQILNMLASNKQSLNFIKQNRQN